MDKPLWMWGVFFAIIIILLVFDLGVMHRRQRTIGMRESLQFSLFYMVIACLFGSWVWSELGPQSGKEFLTGYFVELSLAMDNLFVISLVFLYFSIPPKYQHRVLFIGILSVIVLRGIMIGLGAALVERFHWVLLLFAAFLVYTGVKMLRIMDDMPDIGDNPILLFLRKHLRVTEELHQERFFVRQAHPGEPGRRVWWCTPLVPALAMIECVDIIFAVDSVPAIFAITTDSYIVYTSNIFAILGLRSLYFALAAIMHRFKYFKYAIAIILIFIGGKVLAVDLFNLEKIPATLSLGITLALLAGGILYSLHKTKEPPAGKR